MLIESYIEDYIDRQWLDTWLGERWRDNVKKYNKLTNEDRIAI